MAFYKGLCELARYVVINPNLKEDELYEND